MKENSNIVPRNARPDWRRMPSGRTGLHWPGSTTWWWMIIMLTASSGWMLWQQHQNFWRIQSQYSKSSPRTASSPFIRDSSISSTVSTNPFGPEVDHARSFHQGNEDKHAHKPALGAAIINTSSSPPSSHDMGKPFSPATSRAGHVADPTAWRRQVQQFFHHHHSEQSGVHVYWRLLAQPYLGWSDLDHVPSRETGPRPKQTNVSSSEAWPILSTSQRICSAGPGQGWEEDGGWKLLTETIEWAPLNLSMNSTQSNLDTTTNQSIQSEQENKEDNVHMEDNNALAPRLLCAMYTHSPRHQLAWAAAVSWAWQCDGFLAFSNDTHMTSPTTGFTRKAQKLDWLVDLVHAGPEDYGNMWHKVQAIWTYIYEHHRTQFDYFYLSGDDVYLLVDNLRAWIQTHHQSPQPPDPLLLGQWIRQKKTPYVGGGPGYVLNRPALALLIEQALPQCHDIRETVSSAEDRLLSQCLARVVGVRPADSRERVWPYAQHFHDVAPHTLYTNTLTTRSFHGRAAAYWAQLPPPEPLSWTDNSNDHVSRDPTGASNGTIHVVGPHLGLESAALYSISFHKIYHEDFMARLHVLLMFKKYPPRRRVQPPQAITNDRRRGETGPKSHYGDSSSIGRLREGWQERQLCPENSALARALAWYMS